VVCRQNTNMNDRSCSDTTSITSSEDRSCSLKKHDVGSPVTISGVISKLNSTINTMCLDSTSASESTDHDNTGSKTRGFELHTRLPDGSARPATNAEIATANFQSKLQHTMSLLQSLPDDASRLQWAEDQRINVGNAYYENKQYESAMDIYLTCLTVATPPTGNVEEQDHSSDVNVSTTTITNYTMQHLVLYMKLMNNLALCTIQLHWYQKTIKFCTMAIHQISIALPTLLEQSSRVPVVIVEQRIKLLYKRAKAYRLRGEYDLTRIDIDQIQNLIQNCKCNDTLDSTTPSQCIATMDKSIQKEVQLLKRASRIATQHELQQRSAMQQLLSGKTISDLHRNSTTDTVPVMTVLRPLYGNRNDNFDSNKLEQRTYSTLRSNTGKFNTKTSNRHINFTSADKTRLNQKQSQNYATNQCNFILSPLLYALVTIIMIYCWCKLWKVYW
jgi:tetratricopeptide (TPR) repeat protein